jgi:hypothetical protein
MRENKPKWCVCKEGRRCFPGDISSSTHPRPIHSSFLSIYQSGRSLYGTIEKRAIDQLVRVMLTAELLFAAAGLCAAAQNVGYSCSNRTEKI